LTDAAKEAGRVQGGSCCIAGSEDEGRGRVGEEGLEDLELEKSEGKEKSIEVSKSSKVSAKAECN
jgi:hypothetical protein